MREGMGKYRAISVAGVSNGKFVYGNLFLCSFGQGHDLSIQQTDEYGTPMPIRIDPSTIGQFMLHHKRGAKFPAPEIAFDIWEGDKIYVAGIGNLCCLYDDRCAEWFFASYEDPNAEQYAYHEILEDIERIIGNIHDNPELVASDDK
jgi:hypothetical protein